MVFMIVQWVFIKLYFIIMVEQYRGYGYEMLEVMKQEFKDYGYVLFQSEVYWVLYELVQQGVFYWMKKLKGSDFKVDFQEIVLYYFMDDGVEKVELYKKQVKVDLDCCLGMLYKVEEDNYGMKGR